MGSFAIHGTATIYRDYDHRVVSTPRVRRPGNNSLPGPNAVPACYPRQQSSVIHLVYKSTAFTMEVQAAFGLLGAICSSSSSSGTVAEAYRWVAQPLGMLS